MRKELSILLLFGITIIVVFVVQLVLKGNFDPRSRAEDRSSAVYEYINNRATSED